MDEKLNVVKIYVQGSEFSEFWDDKAGGDYMYIGKKIFNADISFVNKVYLSRNMNSLTTITVSFRIPLYLTSVLNYDLLKKRYYDLEYLEDGDDSEVEVLIDVTGFSKFLKISMIEHVIKDYNRELRQAHDFLDIGQQWNEKLNIINRTKK